METKKSRYVIRDLKGNAHKAFWCYTQGEATAILSEWSANKYCPENFYITREFAKEPIDVQTM